MKRLGRLMAAVTAGAAGVTTAFFFHPREGAKRRRALSATARRETANVAAMVGSAMEARPRRLGSSADEELAGSVSSALISGYGEAAQTLTVSAKRGSVTLRGEVARLEEIADFEDAAREVPGVIEVNNLLRLGLVGQVVGPRQPQPR